MIIQLFLALTLGAFVGGTAGYIGSIMLSKRMSLIGGPLGHLALPGVALAYTYHFDVSLGALIFIVFGATLIWFLQNKTNLPYEAITATVFASSLSIAFLMLKKHKSKALIGDLSQISPYVVLGTVLAAIAIFVVTRYIYKSMVLLNISPDLAQTEGINVKLYNLVYMICVAVTIALCVRIVGGLMTAALVAIPACTSKNVSINLTHYAYISLVVGAVSSVAGIFVAFFADSAPGPLIVIAGTIMFIVSIFVQPQKFFKFHN